MKHLSLLLTVLFAGGIPLTAAALDYGAGQPLLAAENGAPHLPALRNGTTGTGVAGHPRVSGDTADDASATVAHRARTESSHTIAVPVRHPQTVSAKADKQQAGAHESPGEPSWQSLLPGSIQ
jgi:hypothetical protein